MASVVDLKSKEEKDAELDRRIEALRKKNEALVKRHQLIEEDRRRAEQEGIAVTTPRKGKHPEAELDKSSKEKENFSITVDISAGEKRVINNEKPAKTSPPSSNKDNTSRSPTRQNSGRTSRSSGGQVPHTEHLAEPFLNDGDALHSAKGRRISGADGPRRNQRLFGDISSPRGGLSHGERSGRGSGRIGGTPGRGGSPRESVDQSLPSDRKSQEWQEKRRQNIEKMNEEMEQIAEYERSQRDGMRDKNPIRNFLDDPRRRGPFAEGDRKEGSRRHNRNWGGPDFDRVKTGMDKEKESHGRRPAMKNQMDMTMSMTGRERSEYMRWKKEREQIDEERLARHRKPTGQWRREWDAEKTDSMFKDGSSPHVEDELVSRREKEKRGAPKPPTMGEFFPGNVMESRRKRDQQRDRGRNKPYNMHDSRWEEPEDDNEKEVIEEAEKETCVEKAENVNVELKKQPETKVSEDIEVEDADDEGWEDVDVDEEEDPDCSDASLIEKGLRDEESPRAPLEFAAKEQRPPYQNETPKLNLTPPTQNQDKSAEVQPTSPFLPETNRITSDWGEEMEMVSPFVSSSEDSPPRLATSKDVITDRGSRDHMTHTDLGPESGVLPKTAEGLTEIVPEDVECTSSGSHQANTDQDNGEKLALENDMHSVATKNVSAPPPVEDGEKSFADDLGPESGVLPKTAEGLTQIVPEDVECTSPGSHQANTDQDNGEQPALENDMHSVATQNVSAPPPVEDGEKSFADGGGVDVSSDTVTDMPRPSPKERNQAVEEIKPEMEQDIAAPALPT
ncbi:coiled-coil domain-containing protein 9 isoform X1 [Xenopus laevis]|uniref:Coiled-coil domain-containing protein 9 isoform X1 n=1 Tax=Xenopus laevis TaxID=8355 RepID=A0A8J0TR66_XENLA|nr:coiled-coil domain-containing protein 9 isoform X1 [Xenopus laevis]